jgi:hypothetical protein
VLALLVSSSSWATTPVPSSLAWQDAATSTTTSVQADGATSALVRSRMLSVVDNLAYIGRGQTLTIVDVADPLAPRVLGQTPTLSGTPVRMVKVGDYLWVAAASAGLLVVDVSDVTRPREVARYATAYPAWDVAREGPHLYLAAGDLEVLDITNAEAPVRIGLFEGFPPDFYLEQGSYGSHDVSGVAVAKGLAYLLGRATMRIVDVQDPTHPSLLGTYAVRGAPASVPHSSRIVVEGTYAYFVNPIGRGTGLHLVDVADPETPQRVAFLSTIGELAFHQGMVYLATSRGFTLVDATDPHNAQVIVDVHAIPFELEYWGRDLAIEAPYAYVVGDTSFCIFELLDGPYPEEIYCE